MNEEQSLEGSTSRKLRSLELKGIKGKRLTDVVKNNLLSASGKKSFTPKIPQRRTKTDDRRTQREDQRLDRPDAKRKEQGGPRDKSKYRNNLIQTTGAVFGDGPANRTINRESRETFGKGQLTAPNYVPIREKTKVELKEEAEKLSDILGEDLDSGDFDDCQKTIFIQLPLGGGGKTELKNERDSLNPKCELKDIIPKDEKVDGAFVKHMDALKIKKEEIKHEYIQDFEDLISVFSDENDEELLFFLQFPDQLPFQIIQEKFDPHIGQKSKKPTSDDVPEKADSTDLEGFMSSLDEGLIGKLQVLSSGRIRLMLGPVPFFIELGSPLGFYQELASVKLEGEGGDLTVMSPIRNRLICYPDTDSMIQGIDVSRNQK